MDITIILTIIGIVVAIVIGLWQIILARQQILISKNQMSDSTETQNLVTNQKATAKKSKINKREYREQPYPGEIFNVTNQLPLIQRHEARNKYVGLKVKWRGTIQNLYLEANDFVALTVAITDHDTITPIYFKVKPSEYPEVKIAKNGHGILVFGEIESVGNIDVHLKNCKIDLD